ATLAQAYINQGVLDSAVVPVSIAASHTKYKDEEGRYLYIQGQLYNYLEKRDSANYVFEKLIELNRKIPSDYLVNARLEKARNFNYSNEDHTQLLHYLVEIDEEGENHHFLDKIHIQIAEYYNHIDSKSLAAEYYNRAVKHKSDDVVLRSVDHETVENVY